MNNPGETTSLCDHYWQRYDIFNFESAFPYLVRELYPRCSEQCLRGALTCLCGNQLPGEREDLASRKIFALSLYSSCNKLYSICCDPLRNIYLMYEYVCTLYVLDWLYKLIVLFVCLEYRGVILH